MNIWGFQITSPWGDPDHPQGIDIGTPTGTPLVLPFAGTAVEVSNNLAGGKYVSYGKELVVQDASGTRRLRFAHLSDFAVTEGQAFGANQVLGYTGATGNATGPHLHFEYYELRGGNWVEVNPTPFLQSYNIFEPVGGTAAALAGAGAIATVGFPNPLDLLTKPFGFIAGLGTGWVKDLLAGLVGLVAMPLARFGMSVVFVIVALGAVLLGLFMFFRPEVQKVASTAVTARTGIKTGGIKTGGAE